MTKDIEQVRREFETEAEALGFDLTRTGWGHKHVEPWTDYESDDTGHRWGGYLAALDSVGDGLAPTGEKVSPIERPLSDRYKSFEWLYWELKERNEDRLADGVSWLLNDRRCAYQEIDAQVRLRLQGMQPPPATRITACANSTP